MSLNGLPAIDPAEAELRRVAIAALTGVRVEGVPLTARISAQSDRRGGWLGFANGAALALDRLEGAPVRFDPADGVGAAALIERAEPLIAAIEAALSLTLDPRELATDADGLILTVEHGGQARLRLSLPRDLALLPGPADFAPELLAHVALPATIRVEGPRLAPHDAASLVPGDLLLIGSGPLHARLTLGDRSVAGVIEPDARMFRASTVIGAT
jgi:hypothetical protein